MKFSESKIPVFASLNETDRKVQENMNQLNKKIREAMAPAKEYMRKLRESMKELSARVNKVLAELPDNMRKVQSDCANKGWYFLHGDVTPSAIANIVCMIDKKQYEDIEKGIQDFARFQVDDILQKAKVSWPHRFNILKDAFEAHKQGLYTLSIPCLLAQADGISYEILKVSFFGKENRVPKTKKALEDYLAQPGKTMLPTEEITDLLLYPLRTVSSVSMNTNDRDEERKRDPSYGPLNRHGVLHGIDLDYATEANSLRAIMIINYLMDVKTIIDNPRKSALISV